LIFNPGKKSLAYILHAEEGWTDRRMIEVKTLYHKTRKHQMSLIFLSEKFNDIDTIIKRMKNSNLYVYEEIGKGTGDIRIFPLGRVQSRALSSALRYRYKWNYARKMDIYKVKIPVSWLEKKLTFKKFQKKGYHSFHNVFKFSNCHERCRFRAEAHSYSSI